MPVGFRPPPGLGNARTTSPPPTASPAPPNSATRRQSTGLRGSPVPASTRVESNDEPVASSAKSSETHTSEGAVEGLGSAMDSAMMEDKSQIKTNRGNRAATMAIILVVLFGGLTYVFTDWYRKKELRIESQDTPHLAHAVNEVQGWRRANMLAVFIMFITGAGVMLGAVFYRRFRAERARTLDGTYWFLATMSIVSGFLYFIYRIRQRRRKALRKAMEYAAKNPSRLKHKIIGGLLIILIIGLLWYRRRMHALRVKRKKAHILLKKEKDVQNQEVIPQETVLQANVEKGTIEKAVPKKQQ